MDPLIRYRKKPVVIDAVRYEGDYSVVDAWLDALGIEQGPAGVETWQVPGEDQLVIATLEGDMRADVGDWIIRGVAGEFYPCKPSIFDATYEPADGPGGA